MTTKAINELIKMVNNSPYTGLDLTIEQNKLSDSFQVAITGICIIPSAVIEEITAISIEYDLKYYYTITQKNKPQIRIFDEKDLTEDNPF